jgi:hypothetical protein
VWRFNKKGKRFWLLVAVSFALSIALNIWWVPQYLSDVKQDFWIGHVSPWFLARFYIEYFKDATACVVFLVASYFYASHLLREGGLKKLEPFILVGSIILCYLIPLLFSLIWEPMLLARYTMIAVPLVIVFIAQGFQYLPRQSLKVYLPGAVFVSFFIFLIGFDNYYSRPHKTQWRELCKTVLSDSSKNYLFFSSYDFYFNNYFYQLTQSNSVRCDHPETADFEKKISDANGVWVLEAHNNGSKLAPERLRSIVSKLKKDREVNFFQARGTLYVKP